MILGAAYTNELILLVKFYELQILINSVLHDNIGKRNKVAKEILQVARHFVRTNLTFFLYYSIMVYIISLYATMLHAT